MVTSRRANRTRHKSHKCGDGNALGETEGVAGWGGGAHTHFHFKRKRYLIYGEEKKCTIISGTGLNTQP